MNAGANRQPRCPVFQTRFSRPLLDGSGHYLARINFQVRRLAKALHRRWRGMIVRISSPRHIFIPLHDDQFRPTISPNCGPNHLENLPAVFHEIYGVLRKYLALRRKTNWTCVALKIRQKNYFIPGQKMPLFTCKLASLLDVLGL